MDVINKLIDSLGLDNPELLALATEANGIFTQLKSEQGILSGKLTDAITSRDKTKLILKEVKTKLGIEENSELDLLILDEKLQGNEDVQKVEDRYLAQLGDIAKSREVDKQLWETQLNESNDKIKTLSLNIAIGELSDNYVAVEGADYLIKDGLSKGAFLNETGQVRYKKDGETLRNENGVEATALDMLKSLQGTNKFLFKSDVKQSGGTPPNGGEKGTGGGDFATRMKEKSNSMSYGR